MDNTKKAILKTLLYSDIFDFPLTHDELWRFLISDSPISKAIFDKAMKELLQENIIAKQEHLYHLPKREFIIEKRKRQRVYVEKKLMIAKRVSTYLSFIPTISFVGVSGNVAAGNAQADDDIDFFIVARKRTIWTTRFLVLVILEILRKRRRREQENVSDTICVNMMVDENGLTFPSDRHDLFTAHEIVQLRPLFARDSKVHICLVANRWVKKFMPNSIDTKILRYKNTKTKRDKDIISQSLTIFEYLAKYIQLWFIDKHRTTETISDSLIAFHPTDYRKRTLAEFSKRLEAYGTV